MQRMIHKTKAKTHHLTALLMTHRAVMLPERSHRLVTGLTGSRCQVLRKVLSRWRAVQCYGQFATLGETATVRSIDESVKRPEGDVPADKTITLIEDNDSIHKNRETSR